jgi:hypothetical protein
MELADTSWYSNYVEVVRVAAVVPVLGMSMADDTLEPNLIDAIMSGKAVLFLGAGASFGAKSTDGRSIPLAEELKLLIAKKFLGPSYENADFKTVYDFSRRRTPMCENFNCSSTRLCLRTNQRRFIILCPSLSGLAY